MKRSEATNGRKTRVRSPDRNYWETTAKLRGATNDADLTTNQCVWSRARQTTCPRFAEFEPWATIGQPNASRKRRRACGRRVARDENVLANRVTRWRSRRQ